MKPHDLSIAPGQLCSASPLFGEQTGTPQTGTGQAGTIQTGPAQTGIVQTGTGQTASAPGRNPLMAACVGVALAVLLWTCGAGSGGRLSLSNAHPGAHSRTTNVKVWDKHQDLTRASVAAMVRTASRRPQNSSTRSAVPCTAVPLPGAGYRPAEQRRPLALSPDRSQIRLRAPPLRA